MVYASKAVKQEYDKRWLLANKGKIYKRRRELYKINKERVKAKARQNYAENREVLSAKRNAYNKANRARINSRLKEKYRSDPVYRLTVLARSRLRHALNGCYKRGSALDLLGCSIQQAKIHIEALFEPGMSWANHGEWHIDHIIPLSKFDLSNEDQLKIAFNYSNLQPLWAKDNFSKHSKIQDVHEYERVLRTCSSYRW